MESEILGNPNQDDEKQNDSLQVHQQTKKNNIPKTFWILAGSTIALFIILMIFIAITLIAQENKAIWIIDGIIGFFFFILLIYVIMTLQKSLSIEEKERIIIESLWSGFKRVAGPGYCIIQPWEKWIEVVPISEITINLEPSQIESKATAITFADGLSAKVDTSITLQVGKDENSQAELDEEEIRQAVRRYVYTYQDLPATLEQIIYSAVLRIAGSTPLTSLTQEANQVKKGFIEDLDTVQKTLKDKIEEEIHLAGTKITAFSVTSIQLNEKNQKIITNLAEAKTKADARRQEAKGEADAVKQEIEAIQESSEMLISGGDRTISTRDALNIIMDWREQDTNKFIAGKVKTMNMIYGRSGKTRMPRLEIGTGNDLDTEIDPDSDDN